MIKEHITSGHDNKKDMTHRMVERNLSGQDKIKLGHIGLLSSSMCHELDIVISTFDVFFYPTCPIFYIVMATRGVFFYHICRSLIYYLVLRVLCFILSCLL